MKILFCAIIMMAVMTPAYADEGSPREGGLLSEDSFLSQVVDSATNKINRVTSGEEKIVDDDAKGMDRDILEYDGDPFKRPGTRMKKGKTKSGSL